MDSKYNLTDGKILSNSLTKKPATAMKFYDAKRPRLGDHVDAPQTASEKLLQQRKALPVYGVRNRLISEIKKYPTVIIIGETGSGKTTQIPQFMHEFRLDKDGMIGITQPRRVAAITLSKRVAQEMNTEQGEIVGYTVRFEDVTSKRTKLKYLTDGMLLREAILDNLLMSYSIIVLDEAHERTVQTDVLFGIVKQAQVLRQERQFAPLKIIIMSATMDVDHFSDYFGKVPIIYLEGRQYPVQVYHAMQSQDDFVFSSLVTIFQIHKEAPANQDILVFLTGQEEIEAMANTARQLAKDLEGKYPCLKVYPLYASLPSHQQLDVFRPTPHGMRKVILSTNIAETSITIPGIKYVIDSGMAKVRIHHPGTGLDVLKVQKISKAQAMQRAGRAGRESAGFCYRVYNRLEYDSMSQNPVPEVQRCNLSNVVLQLLALGVDPLSFDFMDMPPKEAINEALLQLKQLCAIEAVENPELTKLGRLMSRFPLDPRYSKILLSAKDYGCVEEILSIVSLLSSESVMVTPHAKREEATVAHGKFVSSSGDHVTLLNIYSSYCTATRKKEWCHENFFNARNLAYASEVRSQLAELCQRSKIPSSTCGQNFDQVRKCLITGLFMNIAELQREKKYVTLGSREIVTIHPSSVLFSSRPRCVLFTEVVHTGQCYLRMVSEVEPGWLSDIAPEYMRHHRLLSMVG
ncbi:putative ATP-dependent RNA helicase DHX33 [Blattella germanica]|nr:putative ATP-dependent RNA helicase DHX33 [Blattella germanica]